MLRKENYNGILIFGLALTLLILLGFAAYLFLEDTRVAEAAEDLAYERLQHGREVYNEQCASCHGSQGEGGVGTILNSKTLLQKTHDDRFFSVIRSGVPSTEMPAWSVDFGGPLTDEDIRSTVAYIRSWEDTAPVIEPTVFEPSAEEGALIFDTNCAACHGENGTGTGFAPAVNDPAKLAKADEEYLRNMLQYGLPAQGMPSYGSLLSEEQSEHLLALFSAWSAGEDVLPAYNATSLINAAVFALEGEDAASAILHVDRALSVMVAGPGKEMMADAKSQLEADDTTSALDTLTTLRDQWPIGDPVNGAELYAANCAVCHGDDGEGGGDGAFPPQQPNEFVQTNSNADLVVFIQEGREGTAMAGFDTRLTGQEIADIVAHLRTWQP
jgi:cbb3-type cytochrome c oxidase subunit III